MTKHMRTIHKYHIPTQQNKQVFKLPGLYKIIHFAEQEGTVFFWAEINTDLPEEDIVLEIFGTGWEMQPYDNLAHIGTCLDIFGLVLHLYQHL